MKDLNSTNTTLTRIRQMMEAREWTLYRLSKESGVSYNTLRNLFVRNNEPTFDTARRICECFEVPVSVLLDNNTPQFSSNDISSEEKQLIANYRNLNRNDKKLLLTYLAGLNKTLPEPDYFKSVFQIE